MKILGLILCILTLQTSQAFGLAWPKSALEPFQRGMTFKDANGCAVTKPSDFCKLLKEKNLLDEKLPKIEIQSDDEITLESQGITVRAKYLSYFDFEVNGSKINFNSGTTVRQLFAAIVGKIPRKTSLNYWFMNQVEASETLNAGESLAAALEQIFSQIKAEKSCTSTIDLMEKCSHIYTDLLVANGKDLTAQTSKPRDQSAPITDQMKDQLARNIESKVALNTYTAQFQALAKRSQEMKMHPSFAEGVAACGPVYKSKYTLAEETCQNELKKGREDLNGNIRNLAETYQKMIDQYRADLARIARSESGGGSILTTPAK